MGLLGFQRREVRKLHGLVNPRIRLPRIKSRRPHHSSHKYTRRDQPNDGSNSNARTIDTQNKELTTVDHEDCDALSGDGMRDMM